MVMLDGIESYDATSILCRSTRHLDPANPLRHAGRLPALAGIEFCLQAAALHGGLQAGAAQPPGYVVSLRSIVLHVDCLDDAGPLLVGAVREAQGPSGMSYTLALRAGPRPLVAGRALIKLPT